MLKVYDQYKNIVGDINDYTDLEIVSELETGDKTLSFTHRIPRAEIQNEYYVETQDDIYVVKEVSISTDGFTEYTCQLCLEELEAETVDSFSAVSVTLAEAAALALVGTGWTVSTDITKIRSSVATLRATPRELLEKIRDAWMCEIRYDTKNKIVYFVEEFGEDKGVFFTRSLNLKKLQMTGDTYDYYTRIIPIGADGLTIEDVNDGKNYLENYQYSDKVRTYVWEDTSYEDAEALKEDAEKKLEDMSKPVKSYSVDVADLAKQKSKYAIMDFSLGDTILLLDEMTGIKEKQRIVKLKERPRNPGKNSCELSNTTLTFEELQAKLSAQAAAYEEITNSDGTVNGYYVHGVTSDGVVVIETVVGEDGSTTTSTSTLTDTLTTVNGNIVTISGELDAVSARIGTIEATYVTTTELEASYATIDYLTANYLTADTINATYLTADSAVIKELAADIANFNTLLASYATIDYLTANYADINLANVDIASIRTGFVEELLITQGIVSDAVTAASATITGYLTGVGIIANSITAGTLDCGTITVVNLDVANLTVSNINGISLSGTTISASNLEELLEQIISATNSNDSDIEKALEEAGITQTQVETLSEDMITDVVAYYYQSTSSTELIGGSWSTESPTWTEGTYIWIRQLITYGNGASVYSAATCITGNTGEDGTAGDEGVGIASVTRYYLASSLSTGVTV